MILSPLYEITVYRQSENTGQMYKSQYTARKIFVQKEKHLKFRDFDTKKYAEETFFPRPGRKTNDPKEHMKKKLYPDESN